MNCFEARQNFRAFWRRELEAARRAAMVTHLAQCERCDEAFRSFALSAPVLHSDSEPAPIEAAVSRRSEISRGATSRRTAGVYRGMRRAPAWASIAAATILFLSGASAAYFSLETPVQTLSEAITQPEGQMELVSSDTPSSDLQGAISDFGQ